MARILFKKGEQQTLSGTFCGMTYRTRQNPFGEPKVFVHEQNYPSEPKKKTHEAYNKYRKECVVLDSINAIQRAMYEDGKPSVARMQAIADQYDAIRHTVRRMCEDFRKYFRSDEQLTSAIVYYYRCKKLHPKLDLFAERLPEAYRQGILPTNIRRSTDIPSMKSDKNAALKAPRTEH